MNKDQILIALSALSQETRLDVFRLLVEYGGDGAPAGTLGKKLKVPHNTLSFHLAHLSHAGLVTAEKAGRSIIYRANCKAIESVISFLVANCCARAANQAQACCPPVKSRKEKP